MAWKFTFSFCLVLAILAGHFRDGVHLKKKCHLESGLNQRDRATAGFSRGRSHGKPSKIFYWRGFSCAVREIAPRRKTPSFLRRRVRGRPLTQGGPARRGIILVATNDKATATGEREWLSNPGRGHRALVEAAATVARHDRTAGRDARLAQLGVLVVDARGSCIFLVAQRGTPYAPRQMTQVHLVEDARLEQPRGEREPRAPRGQDLVR